MATKACTYLRVSSKAQIEGDGFPRQRDAVAKYARAHSLEIVGEYRDEGVSGTKELADRQGLADLLARVLSNGVSVVLVERADRLARDLVVGELILAEFRRAGVSVVACDSGSDLTVGDDEPSRRLIRQVLGAVSEFEKSALVAKLRAARIRKRRAVGKCEGRKAFGEKPGEEEILARILRLRRKPRNGERLSFAKIAQRLNTENIPTRTGSPWRASTVGDIITRSRK